MMGGLPERDRPCWARATNETRALNCNLSSYDCQGTLRGPALLKCRKVRATVGQYAPNPPGPHAGCKGCDNGSLPRKGALISKRSLSRNRGLQLALVNLESLVSACQHRAENVSLFLAHTARRFMRVVQVRGLLGFGRACRAYGPQVGRSRNKVAVGEPAAGSPPRWRLQGAGGEI